MTNWIGYCPNMDCIIDPQFFESETKEEAIVPLAKANDLLPGEKISIGVQAWNYPEFDADDIAEYIMERINENTPGGCDSSLLEFAPDGIEDDLKQRLNTMLEAWVDAHRLDRLTWTVEGAQDFVIPDYLDDGPDAHTPHPAADHDPQEAQ